VLPVDSFKKRYFFKLAASIFAMLANVVTQSIIPRALGAVGYGNFNFLTDFFTQVMGFLNMGSSVGFYTKLSKRPDERKLVLFYVLFIAIAVLLAFIGIFLIVFTGLSGGLWPHIPLFYVYAAAGLGGVTWLFMSVNDIADAHALTVKAEIAKVLQRFVGLGLIAVLFFGHWLNMAAIFYSQYILMLVGLLFLVVIIDKADHGVRQWMLNRKDIKGYAKEFYKYCRPLLWQMLILSVLTLFDRWFLQREAGGAQQGFYSLSLKVGAVCLVLTQAMTQLITRDFSIAHHKNDIAEMGRIFRKNIPLMYALTAIMCCFVAVNADKVAFIMGGREFKGLAATLPVMIMAFYPMSLTYAGLSNVVFFVNDQTRIFANITIVAMLLGVPFTYFLIASPAHHGFGAGAVGLAIKVVFFHMMTVNVMLWFNARYLKLPFGWYVRHQVVSCVVFLAVASGVVFVCDHWITSGAQIFLKLIVSGVFYLAVTGAVIYLFPNLLGMDRVSLSRVLRRRNV
jgi:O-antigen/teichoic acid export membrane protein